MATRAFNSRDVDRLFTLTVATIASFAAAMIALGVSTFAGIGGFRWAGYALIIVAFIILIYMAYPAFKR